MQAAAWGAVAQGCRCWVLLDIDVGRYRKKRSGWHLGHWVFACFQLPHGYLGTSMCQMTVKQFSWGTQSQNPPWNSHSCGTYLLIRQSSCRGVLCWLPAGLSVHPAFFYSWHFPQGWGNNSPSSLCLLAGLGWCSLDESGGDGSRAVLDVWPSPPHPGLKAWVFGQLSWKTCKVITFLFFPDLKTCFL